MANAQKGEVAFTIADTDYLMVFDMEAIAYFEDSTDISIFEVAGQMAAAANGGRPPKLSLIGSVLEAGLKRYHPDITRTDAMDMAVSAEGQKALAKAFEFAMPPAESAGGKARAPGKRKAARKR